VVSSEEWGLDDGTAATKVGGGMMYLLSVRRLATGMDWTRRGSKTNNVSRLGFAKSRCYCSVDHLLRSNRPRARGFKSAMASHAITSWVRCLGVGDDASCDALQQASRWELRGWSSWGGAWGNRIHWGLVDRRSCIAQVRWARQMRRLTRRFAW